MPPGGSHPNEPPTEPPATGSHEKDSPSLPQLAANPYTADGQPERLRIEGYRSHQPGRRGKAVRIYLIVPGLIAFGFLIHAVNRMFGIGARERRRAC